MHQKSEMPQSLSSPESESSDGAEMAGRVQRGHSDSGSNTGSDSGADSDFDLNSDLDSPSESGALHGDDLDGGRPRKRRRMSIDAAADTARRQVSAEAPKLSALSRVSRSRSRLQPGTRPDAAFSETAQAPSLLSSGSNGTSRTAVPTTPADEDSKVADPKTVETTAATESAGTARFTDLGVDGWLANALGAMAITRPTAIQAGCIPAILAGHDCIGGSRTGSGKTVAFAVPILQRWARDPVGIFAVVLTPTRELALQMFEQFKALGAFQSLKVVLVTGGADQRQQAIDLSTRPHVVIATPGRLADHIQNSGADTVQGLRRARFVVLDEADRLLSSGSNKGSMLPDVETCLSALPPSSERQTLLFTATVTPEVRALKQQPRPAAKKPVHVCEVDIDSLAVPATLEQTYLQVPVTQREPFLHVLLQTPANVARSVVVFVNRTDTASLLEHMLRLLGHRVTALHSGLPQAERTSNLARFRARAARILVATDVASRGLDIPEVALVLNYDVPRDPADYIHRVGRTARAGKRGVAVTMVGQRDVELVLAIEDRVGDKMAEYREQNVNLETRVVRDALKLVAEKKREAMLQIEEGRHVTGRRKRQKY